MKKTQRQPGPSVSRPLVITPTDAEVPPTAPKIPSARLRSAPSANVTAIMSSAYKRGCLPSSNILQAGQGVDFFAEGKLGMVVGDYLGLKKVQAAGINWGTTAVPTPKGYPPYFFSWSDSVGVMATTDHPDEAKEFVTFVATQGQKIRFETTGDIPLDSKVADKVNWAGGIPGREEGLQIAKHARAAIFQTAGTSTHRSTTRGGTS
jgi:ABC-type glycerol-3-phosphate transport system substrate-binding protein